jgi:uncharacterized protein
MKSFLALVVFTGYFFPACLAQRGYTDSLETQRKKYVKEHEVVKDGDKQWMRFFPPDTTWRIPARFEAVEEAPWFKMETTGNSFKLHRVYGILHFTIHDTALKLHVYQSQDLMKHPQYAHYLFIPFTDKTSGGESYENGRYIDLLIADLETGSFIIDFNKAYNPYCAYPANRVFHCPIPPKENSLPVAIRAGEMRFERKGN